MRRRLRIVGAIMMGVVVFCAGPTLAAEPVPPGELARMGLKNPAAVLTGYPDGVVIEALVHEVQVFDLPDGSRVAGVFLGQNFAGGYTIKNFSPFGGRPFEIVCGFPLDVAANFERKQPIKVRAHPIDLDETAEYDRILRRQMTTTTLVAECALSP